MQFPWKTGRSRSVGRRSRGHQAGAAVKLNLKWYEIWTGAARCQPQQSLDPKSLGMWVSEIAVKLCYEDVCNTAVRLHVVSGLFGEEFRTS